jgi:hypothetical protein
METNLRPMSLGEILDRTAQLYRTNFLLFAGIAAIYAGVLLVINLIQLGVTQLMLHWHMTQQVPLATLGYVVVIFPVILLCATAAVAANNRAVSWVNLGQPATIRGAYKSIWPKLGRYLWLAAIIGFIIYLPFILIFSAYSGFLYGYARPKGFFHAGQQADASGMIVVGLVSFLLFVLILGWIVYAVLMALRYSLAVPACVIEDIPARQAIKRSVELSKESRGRIFVLGLLILAIQLGLVMISQLFFVVAAFMAIKHHGTLPVWMQALQQIVGFFTNSFIGPMYATGLTLFYYDQRVRKEGYDIERMMEAAGMNAPPAFEASPVSDPVQPVKDLPESAFAAPEQEAPESIPEPEPPAEEPPPPESSSESSHG